MGLDMYFYLKTKERVVPTDKVYEGEYEENYKSFTQWHEPGQKDETTYPEDIKKLGDYIYNTNFKSQFNDDQGHMFYQVGYFRKFNALHGYIVDNLADGIDECQDIEVSEDELLKLLSILDKVNGDNSAAYSELPTKSGFFFGSYDYDNYYYEDIKAAVEMCELFYETIDFTKYDLIYHASW